MRLGDITEIRMGFPFRSRLRPDPQGDVAVIQMKDIDEANLIQTDDALRISLRRGTRHLLEAGDVLFRSRGRTNGAARVPEGMGPAVLSAPMLLIRPRDVLPDYLCWFLNGPAAQAQLTAVAEGTSVRMISADSLRSLDIPLPSRATQERIAQLAALAAQEQSLLAQIADLRRRQMNQLLAKTAEEAIA